jgi:hypothetical protein
MTPEHRKKIEYQIVGSCIVNRGMVTAVSHYVTDKNMVNPEAKIVMKWLMENNDPSKFETDMMFLKLVKEMKVSSKQLFEMMLSGVPFLPLKVTCMALLEANFREAAVNILKQNRDKALRPLGPLEADIANPENEIWQIITAAANYCSDIGLPEICDALSNLLSQMEEKLRSLQSTKRTGFLVASLKNIADQSPDQLKEFKEELKEIYGATT